jgi:hypothetical protein
MRKSSRRETEKKRSRMARRNRLEMRLCQRTKRLSESKLVAQRVSTRSWRKERQS